MERLSVPRRKQASIVSLKFYCTLAEPYALLVWAAPGGVYQLQTKVELGSFCLEKKTWYDYRNSDCPSCLSNIVVLQAFLFCLLVCLFPSSVIPERIHLIMLKHREKVIYDLKMTSALEEGKASLRQESYKATSNCIGQSLELESIC